MYKNIDMLNKIFLGRKNLLSCSQNVSKKRNDRAPMTINVTKTILTQKKRPKTTSKVPLVSTKNANIQSSLIEMGSKKDIIEELILEALFPSSFKQVELTRSLSKLSVQGKLLFVINDSANSIENFRIFDNGKGMMKYNEELDTIGLLNYFIKVPAQTIFNCDKQSDIPYRFIPTFSKSKSNTLLSKSIRNHLINNRKEMLNTPIGFINAVRSYCTMSRENSEGKLGDINVEIQKKNDLNVMFDTSGDNGKIDSKTHDSKEKVHNPIINGVPLEFKHIKIENNKEIIRLHEKFPQPKNTLHSYYNVLATQLNDKTLKVDPLFRPTSASKTVEWVCSYNIKWPINCKISAQSRSKKKASALAALGCLDLLIKYKKLSPNGAILLYDKEQIKTITQKNQSELNLSNHVIEKMKNIVSIVDENLLPQIKNNYYDNLVDQDSKVVNQEVENFSVKSPIYLGMHQYLAREMVVLPISKYKESFIDLIQNNSCVIVKGEPGCGKSSRVPQYVLESWARSAISENQLCSIAVTQPRRIAAISLAERVASEREEQVGKIVGYQVRLKSNFIPKTGRILYCTTGILLRHLQSDPSLSSFSHVILDEAHERDINTDLLMNLLKNAMKQNDELKVVVMSATIDAETFSQYFDDAPILNVPGFTYPVTRHFLDNCKINVAKTLKMCQGENPVVVHDDIAEVVKYIHKNKPEGAILVFLPGWEDLVKVARLIGNRGDLVVHMVHSKLKDSEQHRIFSRPPPGVRKIILGTNIAETSITIDDVVYVVDVGMHKDQIFDNDKGVNVLDMEWISKASANQRAGRAGRCAPGESYHLYTLEKFNQFQDYTSPKILNSSLTKVVLDSKAFSNNMDASDFMNSLITPPEKSSVERAVDELKQLELIDENEKLTPLGKTLVNFQLEPSLAKAMVNGVIFKCTSPIVDIVTLFSSDTGIFGSLTLTEKDVIKNIKSKFSKSSDHLAMMRMYEKWLEIKEEEGFVESDRFCRNNNLVPHKLGFVDKLKDIHFGYITNGLNKSMPVSDNYSDNGELVKAVLYSGTGTVLEHRNWDIVKKRLKTNTNVLVTRNNHKATISSESVNHRREKYTSNFLVYINETRSNIRRTTIIRECSLIPTISVLLFTNKELEIINNNQSQSLNDESIILGIKNTNIQVKCDRRQADILIECKKAIEESYKYLIYQLTYAHEEIPEFLEHWDSVLQNLCDILEEFEIE